MAVGLRGRCRADPDLVSCALTKDGARVPRAGAGRSGRRSKTSPLVPLILHEREE